MQAAGNEPVAGKPGESARTLAGHQSRGAALCVGQCRGCRRALFGQRPRPIPARPRRHGPDHDARRRVWAPRLVRPELPDWQHAELACEAPASGVILSQLPVASPLSSGLAQQSVGPAGFIPSQIVSAYGVNKISFGGLKGDGTGQTIGIFEEGSNPAFVDTSSPNYSTSALAIFDKTVGIPDPPSLTFYDLNGNPITPANPGPGDYGNGLEIALDIEWAHAIAPGASIDVLSSTPDAADTFRDIPQGMATLAGLRVCRSFR